MPEPVTRHRGGGFDDDDDPIPYVDAPLTAYAVAPGATAEYIARGRNGARIEYSVYFIPPVDLVDTDQMTVRGGRFDVQVEQWISPYVPSHAGTVALCTRGEG
jgi:hypothetical protein